MNEKTEPATSRQLEKAREKGHVNQSSELTICLSLLITLSLVTIFWSSLAQTSESLIGQLLFISGNISFNSCNSQLQGFIFTKIQTLWLPFAAVSSLSIILITVLQTGFTWSTKALIPDFKRLNLRMGFKKLLSLRAFFDASRNFLKTILFFLLITQSLYQEIHILDQNQAIIPRYISANILPFLLRLLFKLLFLLCGFAILDKFYTHWKYRKENKMSKKDRKEEYRSQEGDPQIKARIKQLRYKNSQQIMALHEVKTADVVITNPSHLAIALKYQPKIMPSPKVVCKARGELAAHMKILARRHNIPIISNKLFAQALFTTVDLNKWIKQEHFPIAAMIFSDLYKRLRPDNE